jgi:HD-GYP domain-containing protein (c-di-GMP phosphodiesterase class II)
MTIKTNILIIFLSLVGIVALSLLFLQYYFSEKLAIESTNKTFTIISKNISEHLRKEGTSTRNILNAKSKHKDLLEPITFNPVHPSLKSLIQVLQIKSNLHSIYFAHLNGSFYEVINMQNRPLLFQTLNAPKLTRWAIITIIDNKQQNAFLDRNFKLISKRSFSKKYDPLIRPWYIKAVNSKTIINTMPYLFSNIHQMGITYAKELDTKGIVLALDYTMEQLNNILALQKFDKKSEIFMVDRNGKKFASSAFKNKTYSESNDSTAQTKMLDTKLMQVVLENKTDQIIKYKEGEDHYFTMFKSLVSKDTYLGIKVDAEALLKPYRDSIRYALFIAFILLLLAIPIIFLSTNRIVKPIKSLILENSKIKNREFSQVNAIKTHIVELQELSGSLVSMSQSIQAHQRSQEKLLDAIIKLIAEAIDAKSSYTGGHCERVPEIAQLLLDEANKSTLDVFKTFALTSKDALREFEIGAWLHDCGKVTTPEYVVDKSTKLETIYNRIHEIRMRFEVLWRDAQIEYLKKEISLEALHVKQTRLRDDFAFIAATNIGGEFMDETKQARVKAIAKIEWERHFDDRLGLGQVEILRYADKESEILPVTETLLSDKADHIVARENFDHQAYKAEGFKEDVPEHLYNYGEIYNLCITKGTLTPEERYKINEHVIMSIKMLEKIPFPSHLNKIPEYAGTHHETLIGTGYPRKLTKNELSIPARIMAIADIFEALTASDRPYKKSKTLSESIKIMSFMVKDQHIDADLFKLFLSSSIYKIYAQRHLKPEQIDEVDVESYLG